MTGADDAVSGFAELDDGVCNPMWSMRGLSQTFHFWREAKRTASLPLNTYLTYVMLPWHTIISGGWHWATPGPALCLSRTE